MTVRNLLTYSPRNAPEPFSSGDAERVTFSRVSPPPSALATKRTEMNSLAFSDLIVGKKNHVTRIISGLLIYVFVIKPYIIGTEGLRNPGENISNMLRICLYVLTEILR